MKTAKVTVPLLIGASINLVQDVRDGGKNTLQIVFGTVALFAGLTAVGEFLDWDVAAALAILYLLHTLLTDGKQAIDWFAKLTASI